MRTFATAVTAASLALALVTGCSATPKKDADDGDSKWDMSSDGDAPKSDVDQADPEPDGDRADDDGDAPAPKPKPKPPTQEDDFEINHQDCEALAGAYGRAWENDEMKKLNEKKLPQKQFDKAAAEVKKNGQEVNDNWRDQCYGTVGTAYLRSRLKCAMKAKSIERFNNCMDGLADNE